MHKPNLVWIIDDDRSIRWVLEKALQQSGIATSSFESGDKALVQLSSEKPQAIISDVRMPGIDGLDMLDQVHVKHPNLPVIIMTAHSDLDSAVSAYQGGAFEYLPKPFDVDEAVAVTQRALAHAKEKEQFQTIEKKVKESQQLAKEIQKDLKNLQIKN